MSIVATNLRRGMTIMFEGEPCRVIEFHHHTPGNLRAMVHAKLRKLRSGVTIEHRFRASDQMEEAVMETHTLQYLYHAGDTYHFMNTESYDQLEMDGEALGDAAQWMTDGMQIIAEFYNGRAVAVDMPNALTFEVVETSPVMRSATKTASTKPAKLSNGVTVNVPEFIQTGEKVRVNPTTGEYLDRAK
jgi:elongation factor P